jgi:hypothetical protein
MMTLQAGKNVSVRLKQHVTWTCRMVIGFRPCSDHSAAGAECSEKQKDFICGREIIHPILGSEEISNGPQSEFSHTCTE